MPACVLCGRDRAESDVDHVDLTPTTSLAICRRRCAPAKVSPEPAPLPWEYDFNPRTQRIGRAV